MDKNCTVYRTAGFVGKRWTLLILLELYKGHHRRKRYTELKGSLPGITAKLLSLRLRELARQGMVKKVVDASSFPVKSEYSLTRSGQEFIAVVKGMKAWALKWKFKDQECSSQDCESCMR